MYKRAKNSPGAINRPINVRFVRLIFTVERFYIIYRRAGLGSVRVLRTRSLWSLYLYIVLCNRVSSFFVRLTLAHKRQSVRTALGEPINFAPDNNNSQFGLNSRSEMHRIVLGVYRCKSIKFIFNSTHVHRFENSLPLSNILIVLFTFFVYALNDSFDRQFRLHVLKFDISSILFHVSTLTNDSVNEFRIEMQLLLSLNPEVQNGRRIVDWLI